MGGDRSGARQSPAGSGSILVEVGPGELLDKITILQIKGERIADPAKLANVRHELGLLEDARRAHVPTTPELVALEAELKAVNIRLWQIEDDIRACEDRADFGADFVALARDVYRTNDHRAALKRRINVALQADVIEEKSYGPTAFPSGQKG